MPEPVFIPLENPYRPDVAPEDAARSFCEIMQRRRSIRMFSDRPVARETIEWIVRAAGTAPSGANKQPWRFVCVQDPAVKRKIRLAAEKEEREFYSRRASPEWLADLEPLGKQVSPGFYADLKTRLGDLPVTFVSHEAFKEKTAQCKAVIRTGEVTPYANIILCSGVSF